jgi:hypothetical protein
MCADELDAGSMEMLCRVCALMREVFEAIEWGAGLSV